MVAPAPNDRRVTGPLEPMRFEATVEDLVVTQGRIPEELNDGFYRCGPTWKRPSAQGTVGFITMDGMVQGLTFREGRADFRNRWIRTPKYLLEERLGRSVFEWEDCVWGDWRDLGAGEVIRNGHTENVIGDTPSTNVSSEKSA